MNMPFDPDAAAVGESIFGLPFNREQSRIVITPAPFDATTSYRPGTVNGPSAILRASAQVDLYDRRFGRIYERGIFMEPESDEIRRLSSSAAALARPLIDAGGAQEENSAEVAKINAASQKINAFVYEATRRVLAEGRIPGLLGGEHSVPFGAIRACAEHAAASGRKLGILHIDAHMDLREAYEGFAWSHASIMHNVLTRIPQVSRLVQVGIRDFGEGELNFAKSDGTRVTTFFDDQWAEEIGDGTFFRSLCTRVVNALPDTIYISFDIDGLDPSLCPHTGTPVPGGLSFQQAALLLDAVAAAGKRVIGFDLVEVAPGLNPDEPEWDANVGARVLYKLCGAAMASLD